MSKKIIAILLAVLVVCSFAACKKTETTPDATGTDATGTDATVTDAVYNVGICQLVQHDALDAATKGFRDALEAALPGQVNFDEQNASGDTANCSTIINGFISKDVDLIMANATPPLQAAASATATIPVLGTSITDYATALEIDNWTGTVGTNVSGASDLAPLSEQAALIKELFPDAETIGMLFCSAEANSRYQINVMTDELEKLGYTCKEFAFTDTNDVASVTQAACDGCDVIYIPTDNAAASNTEAISNIVIPAGKPVVAGEEGICAGCGVATLSINYYDLGVTTGEMAAKVLKGEADISEMAIQYAANVTKKYNAANCEALGITPPEGYEAIG